MFLQRLSQAPTAAFPIAGAGQAAGTEVCERIHGRGRAWTDPGVQGWIRLHGCAWTDPGAWMDPQVHGRIRTCVDGPTRAWTGPRVHKQIHLHGCAGRDP